MLAVQVRRLRQIHREFQANSDVKLLLTAVEEMRKTTGIEQVLRESTGKSSHLTREDLRLICFDLLTSG
jgi:hypothetical protein